MGSYWNPKPIRPETKDPIFPVEEKPVVVKGLNAWQRQRAADGTPHTRMGHTSLRPPDVTLTLKDELVKGSLVEKYAVRPKKPKTDPVDPIGVIKSYLNQPDKDKEEKVEKSQNDAKLLSRMTAALSTLLAKVGSSK